MEQIEYRAENIQTLFTRFTSGGFPTRFFKKRNKHLTLLRV